MTPDIQVRERIVTTREWAVSLPANDGAIREALRAVDAFFTTTGRERRFEDDVRISSDGTELVFAVEMKDVTGPTPEGFR